MSQIPLVSVILVNYNGQRDLEACVASVLSQSRDVPDLEVVVIDNNSSDRSLELLRDADPRVMVYPQSDNLGFAEGNNAGVRKARGEWVAFLNVDARAQRGWLEALLEAAQRFPDAGAYSSSILQFAGAGHDFISGSINFEGYGFQSPEPLANGAQLLFPSGAGFMMRRSLWEECGGMDPSFFLFFEDIDLGWRLNLWDRPTIHVAGAKVRHRTHGAVDGLGKHRRMRYYVRNALRMIIKNYSDANLPPLLAASSMLLSLRLSILELDECYISPAQEMFALSKVRAELPDASGILGLVESGKGLDSLLDKRKLIQQRREVDDEEIFSKFFTEPFRTWAFDDEDYAKLEECGYEEQKARIVKLFNLGGIFHR
jgi:GT2 family glycosyltransferase